MLGTPTDKRTHTHSHIVVPVVYEPVFPRPIYIYILYLDMYIFLSHTHQHIFTQNYENTRIYTFIWVFLNMGVPPNHPWSFIVLNPPFFGGSPWLKVNHHVVMQLLGDLRGAARLTTWGQWTESGISVDDETGSHVR